MNRREDLLELTPQALTALANAGFVKRAQREVAAGQLPTLTIDDQGVVTAEFDDGVVTRFAPGVGLHDAQCNCPASGMCRHRVTLVLAWQAGFHSDGASADAANPAASPASAAAGQAGEANAPAAGGAGSPTPGAAAPATAASMAAEAFSPADFDDAQLSTALGATALAQATRFAQQQPTVRVQAWQAADAPPLARLPMCTVRFFSRHNLQLARCDCVAGGRCAHVALAVWAFRQARPAPKEAERVLTLHGPVPFGASQAQDVGGSSDGVSKPAAVNEGGEPEYSVKDASGDGFGMRSEQGVRARQALDALLTQLWLDGAAQPQLALASRITALRVDLQALGWQWVLDALDELEALIHALAARSTRFDPMRLLDVSTELWARSRAAEHQWQHEQGRQRSASQAAHQSLPAAEVLGRGVRGEVALDHLRLVSLGGNLWSDLHAEGASVFLADPDTQSVLVLEREWAKEGTAAAAPAGSGPMAVVAHGSAPAHTSLLQRRVVNVPLRQLLDSQIVTKAAKRRANGVVDIGSNKRQTGVLPLSSTAWQELSQPLCQPSISALAEQLSHQIPAFVAPRHAAGGAAGGVSGSLHVVRMNGASLAHWHWDSAAQCVHALWLDAADNDADTAQPGGAQSLADAANGAGAGGGAPIALKLQLPYTPQAPGAVDALAKVLSGTWGEVLAIAGPAWRADGDVCMQPTAIICAQRALSLAAFAPEPQAMPNQTEDGGETMRSLALRNALSHAGLLLRDGVRHQGGTWPQTVQEHAQLLRRAGFDLAARNLAELPTLALGAQRERLLPQVSQLCLLLRELQA